MVNRCLTLLLSCLFAHLLLLGCGSALGAVVFGLLGFLVDPLFDAHERVMTVIMMGLASAVEYAVVGLLFSLWAPVRWREASLWTWLGVAGVHAASLGSAYFTTPWAIGVDLLIGVTTATAVCWYMDHAAEEPWVHKAHDLLDSFTPR